FLGGKWHVGKFHDVDDAGRVLNRPDLVSTPSDLGFDEWFATPRSAYVSDLNAGCGFPRGSGRPNPTMGFYSHRYFLREYSRKGQSGTHKFAADARYQINPKDLLKSGLQAFQCENFWYVNPSNPTIKSFDRKIPGWGGYDVDLTGVESS